MAVSTEFQMSQFDKRKPISRAYEGVVLLHPDATEEVQKSLFSKTKGIVSSYGGSWNHCDSWGKRKLANPIEKLPRAHYFHYTFEADSQAIQEIERTLRINEAVLRFHHFRLPAGLSPQKHVESFRDLIKESAERERDRAEKFEKKRQKRV